MWVAVAWLTLPLWVSGVTGWAIQFAGHLCYWSAVAAIDVKGDTTDITSFFIAPAESAR
jgi:hypothetical protein